MHPAVAVGLVFGGCCSNVVFLELLARQFPGCGNIVTFSQFLFIAVEGFIFEANFGRKRPAIPIRYYFIMVAMFFTVSVVNNYALNLNIAMPLHMIFRSGSLIASMALGIIILKKRYSVSKYTSIALVSVGIFTCTFMSAKQVASDSSLSEEDGLQVFLWWLLGIAALTFALLMSARMGIFQEMLYKQFGKHSKEALFYNHALPLPGFLLLAPNIYHHAVLFSQSDIQEFYEVTLLNSQKSYEQKIEEANQVAEKWEKTTSATDHENLQKNQEFAASSGSEGSGQCGEHNKENQTFENYVVDTKTKVLLAPTSRAGSETTSSTCPGAEQRRPRVPTDAIPVKSAQQWRCGTAEQSSVQDHAKHPIYTPTCCSSIESKPEG